MIGDFGWDFNDSNKYSNNQLVIDLTYEPPHTGHKNGDEQFRTWGGIPSTLMPRGLIR